MKKRKIITAALAMTLSAATATTGIVSNPQVYVQAAENTTVKKLADSSVSGFFYQYDKYGDVQCTTDKTYVYTSYDEAVKDIGTMAKKIYLEDKYDKFSLKIPMEIKTGEKVDKIENNQFDKDIQKVIREDTGKADEGYTLVFMQRCGGEVYSEDGDSFRSSYTNGTYKGYYGGIGGYRDMSDRYHQTVKKINTVIESLNLDGKSDYDKFKAITNWIVSNVKYDSHYNGEPNTPAGTKYPHDMTGAVLDGYAVCDGYAGLFYYMANAVGLKALYEDGTSISENRGHAWNLLEMDNTYYYVDPTNAYFKEDGEPGSEVLYGQKYFFTLYKPDSTTIEDTYKNISQDDWLKEHSVCKGNHNFYEAGGKTAQCETPATTRYRCSNPGCLYKYEVEKSPALGHAWDEGKITQEQSCDNPEITTYTCTRSNCRKKKQVETKPALGHTWDEGKITKEATCTEKGIKTYTCSRCGETKTEEIPKTKHDYEEHVVKAPTCTEKGVSYYVCKNCGLTTSRRQTPATGHIHTEVRNQKDATYKEEGYTGDTYCKDCGKKLETGTVIPKLVETEHDYGEWVLDQAPTCKKYGARHRICKNCGDREVDVLDKVDHSWELVSTTPATCTIGEIQHYKCSVCGETKDVTLSNPLGEHSWDNGKVTKEATCTKDGEKTYTCTVCNTTKTEVIPATGHQHKEVRNAKKATCTEDGYTGDTYCTDCNTKLESGTVINKLGHTWDNGVITKEATETEEGVKTYTCKTCGKTKTESIPMAYHHWDQGTVTKEPTCTEKGEKTHHCTDEGCDKTWIETIPATGHQHTEIRDKKEATCEENGYSGDIYCADCGELIKKGSATEKADHTWKLTKEQNATCEADGSKTYTCEVCGETKTETIKATGHQFSAWKTIQEQSVFSDGVQERTCSICGKKETRNTGKKLKATITTNASSLKLKRRQSTKKFVVSGLAKGDSVKSWASSNKKIVSVSGKTNGTCTIKAGNKTGKAKITITLVSGLKKVINVTVQKKAVTCTSIKNVPKKITLNAKKSYQLKPVINPITCTDKIKYKTSNKKIVKVTSRGKITTVKKGKAKVTIIVGKRKFVCTVTVK